MRSGSESEARCSFWTLLVMVAEKRKVVRSFGMFSSSLSTWLLLFFVFF